MVLTLLQTSQSIPLDWFPLQNDKVDGFETAQKNPRGSSDMLQEVH